MASFVRVCWQYLSNFFFSIYCFMGKSKYHSIYAHTYMVIFSSLILSSMIYILYSSSCSIPRLNYILYTSTCICNVFFSIIYCFMDKSKYQSIYAHSYMADCFCLNVCVYHCFLFAVSVMSAILSYIWVHSENEHIDS